MPILIAIVVIAAVLLWLLPNPLNSGSSRPLKPFWHFFTRRKPCRWRPTGTSGESLRAFECETCGITAYSSNAVGPQDCKRGLDSGGL